MKMTYSVQTKQKSGAQIIRATKITQQQNQTLRPNHQSKLADVFGGCTLSRQIALNS